MSYTVALDSTSTKYLCPKCNKKTLVAYLYTATGKPVNEKKFGRCDRENNCQYHLPPGKEELEEAELSKPVAEIRTTIQQIYPDQKVIDSLLNAKDANNGNFYRACRRLGIPEDHLIKWNVFEVKDKTVFLFQNQNGKYVNIKYFKFDEKGHRVKGYNAYSLKQPKQPAPRDGTRTIKKYFLCLFGEHHLDPEKKRKVCVVESEKTAVIASFFYPQFDWVACGSSSGLSDGSNETANKIVPLFNRTTMWLCDADKAGRSNSSIRKMQQYEIDHQVVDLFPDRSDSYDIADAIFDGVRPEIKPPEKPLPEEKEHDYQEYLYNLPKGVTWNRVKSDVLRYNHFIHRGRIYMIRKPKREGDGYNCVPITNFTIKPIGLIYSKADPRRLLEIKNIHNHNEILEVPTKAFTSQTEFTVFVESIGNFQYDGVGIDLKKIRSKLYDLMAKYEEVETLGWHKDGYFIFANGVMYNDKFIPMNDYGFVKLDKKNFYIAPLSCINKDDENEYEDEKKLIYRGQGIDVKDWAELFCKVHQDNGKIVLIWYISALFRDLIYRRLKFFPHWYGFGPSGTGKSQVGWSIRATFFSGIKKPFNLFLGTPAAFAKEVSQFRNVPCWYDEYKNEIEQARIDGLKGFYDGSGHTKSIKDSKKRLESIQVLSACMITGQHLPIADIALLTRTILSQFTKSEFNTEQRKLYNRLEELQEQGFPHISMAFIRFRKTMEENYYTFFDDVANSFQEEFENIEVHTRLIRNMAVLLTTFKVLESKLKNILPFTYQEFWDLAVANVKEQAALIMNANETNTFWDIVSFLIDQGLIEKGVDFDFAHRSEIKLRSSTPEPTIKRFGTMKELLFLRMSRIIPLYKEYFNRQNKSEKPLDKGSLIHYLQHSKAFIGSVKNYRFESAPTTAYVFDNEYLASKEIELKRGYQDKDSGQEDKPVIPLPNKDQLSSDKEQKEIRF